MVGHVSMANCIYNIIIDKLKTIAPHRSFSTVTNSAQADNYLFVCRSPVPKNSRLVNSKAVLNYYGI